MVTRENGVVRGMISNEAVLLSSTSRTNYHPSAIRWLSFSALVSCSIDRCGLVTKLGVTSGFQS